MSGSPSVTIQRQPRLKRINLTVIKDQIIVKGPINMRDKEAQNILNQHHSWVQKQLKAYQDLQKKYPEPQFITNATHFYLGNPYKLQFKPQSPPSIWLDNQTLIMAGYSEHNDNQGLQKALNKWYQDQARDILTDRVHIHAQKMNCQVNQIRIKSQKSRWGSCSSKKNINLNWRLIKAPLHIIDYVVIHELCHLTHMHHQAAFWQLVQQYDPAYKSHIRWLKKYGVALKDS